MPGTAMPLPAADLIVLDTLGKLADHGHGVGRYCLPCRRYSGVPMPVLIAARGADSPFVGMRLLKCAGCGGRETEIRVTAPSKGASSGPSFLSARAPALARGASDADGSADKALARHTPQQTRLWRRSS
jgi:hypothetical protein